MSRRGRPDYKPWTDFDDNSLRALFANTHNQVLADFLGRSEAAISNRAAKLGVRKSADYIARSNTRFKPGEKPWNTGLTYQPGGRSVESRFKAGHMGGAAQHNYKPIGSLRINKDGYLERKVTDDHPVPARRWVGVHRLVWEATHGPVAAGHMVRFKPGMHTTELHDITLDRLECITLRENMKRNSMWVNYPPEVARLIQLKGAINRQANRINKEQEAA
jgi:hypothetical protein